jgi:hypothetical protein
MVLFFQILIVLVVLFFGACIVIGIKAMIEDLKSPNQGRNEKFIEWLKTKEHGETYLEWLRKNYPNE